MKKLFLFLTIILFTNTQAQAREERIIIGRVEHALVRKLGDNHNVEYKARIDTGAGVSSLHAKIIEFKKRNSNKYAIFDKGKRGF
jgi:hypothetical protein